MRHVLVALAFVPFLLAPAMAREAEQTSAAARVGRIRIRGDDLYRITPKQLGLLGIRDPRRVDVRRGGKNVAVWRDVLVDGKAGCVVFAARDVANGHSQWALFEVYKRAAPARAPNPATPFKRARLLATDRVLGALGAARADIYAQQVPVWFLGYAPRGEAMPAMLGPLGATKGALQKLVARVYAAWHGRVDMEATWNGRVLGRASAAGAVGGATLTWHVPADAVPAAAARLTLRNVSPEPPPPPPRDVSTGRGRVYVDSVRLEGESTHVRAPADALPCIVERAGAAPDPAAACRGAAHVIVAVPALVAESRRLAAHRTQQGLRSVVVDVTHVYERYGHGEHVPLAIRAFLTALRKAPGTRLAYVLLAGDATFNRTDLEREVTIPAPVTRSKYNGATAADRLYVDAVKDTPVEPAIGRLPFRHAAEMKAYVDRLIRYETKPPAHASRRMLRFITSEGRFSAIIDKLIENKFRSVLARQVPPAYDVEVTYANPRSAFLWPPPELSSKVLAGLNDGALFYTYVGHGFEKGFDTLRVGERSYGILHVSDVEQVDIRGTPPVVCVLACTTAMVDGMRGDGIGEALMKRPNGPVAYWGSARICHPLYNAFIGEAIAGNLGKDKELPRIGAILARSRQEAPRLAAKWGTALLNMFPAVDNVKRIFAEGALMYTLLGDPALRVAFPKTDLAVAATHDAATRAVAVRLTAELPDGTEVQVALETPRNVDRSKPERVADPRDPASFPTIRKNHARMNDRAIERTAVTLQDGKADATFTLPEGVDAAGLVLKAWCLAEGDVHQGAAVLKAP